ncbi:MAG: GNAT family N-acetyltransferase [Spirochaetales bacterium]|nr:GNAT family N-acetyltransferase [Spirochaetales bacterium]
MIKKTNINDSNQVDEVIEVIRQSHQTVAAEFSLTKENAPGHTSFITGEKYLWNRENKAFFHYELDNRIVGCIVIEKGKEDQEFRLENVSVIPDLRHKGYGRELVNYAIEDIKAKGGQKILIGLIDENRVLKEWYADLGFREISTKKFDHLPFTVCFMKYLLEG